MKNIKVVIGANFGDEGKGLMTDYLSSTLNNGIVVRFNGGAQAGHTVVTPNGDRHVFGHFGSGSFLGLPTYLSRFFVVNPITYIKELNSLKSKNVKSVIFMDKDCYVTTPYDMMINQIAEMFRGRNKHGSCGLGFNETIQRSISKNCFKLTVKDLKNETLVRKVLKNIKDLYLEKRLMELGVDNVPDMFLDIISSKEIVENYLLDIKNMINTITITNLKMLDSYDSVLFEGAQGLLLDQNHEFFPHVTRSNTGMKNVSKLIKEAGYSMENTEIVYATRAYMTRHGVGPFPTELEAKPYEKIEDLTNVPNPYQDTLRFGLLDLDLLAKTIQNDLLNAKGLKYKVNISISCLDQLDEEIDYYYNSNKMKTSVDDFIKNAFEAVDVSEGYLSYGASRNTIKNIIYRFN
ncbi:adenylosuccinate synthase [Clostridium carboxidivorans P7]|uniref:Adenylosuccinate synthetase n=1 Tax=Clostridium carboxidivorans P7 TaxID=536227 RepID=C6PY11_9CLOT|nr:adenylosuccinate synthetase [Clostridium carboxidivorans]AKN31198.1 adenylosuccinate synthase [Clostridium carboxidivorans P7]EET85894.1 Adenylosuccinate synthase [Clostridium carboxidivorans P7]EFG88312.1 adenylosuccinate synthase [Clostridium carboxidivorans P7]